MRRFTLFPILAIILSGCATITRGPIQKIDLESKPVAATVMVANKNVGTTPCEIHLPRAFGAQVKLEKEGFITENIHLKSRIGSGSKIDSRKALVFILISLLPPNILSYAVDLITTSIFNLQATDTNNLVITPEDPDGSNMSIVCRLKPQ